MLLTEVFTRRDALATLIESACATDDAQTFIRGVQAMEPNVALAGAVRASANDFADAAGVAQPVMRDDGPIAFAGQQPYVDYYPAVPVKLDALASCGGASFYGFADYAPLGSDPWMARTELPVVTAADGVLRLCFLRSLRSGRGRDLRFVPPPDAPLLALIGEKLKGMITEAARHAAFEKRDAYRRLRELMDEYDEARRRARSLGVFNAIASVRLFRGLGFSLPFVLLSDLLAREELLPSIGETLAVFIREHALVVEAVNEAMAYDERGELHFTRKESGHVPLAIAGADDDIRRPVRLVMHGDDHLLVAGGETFNAGQADAASLVEVLQRLRGRWSLDVFAPLFLFRLGVTGIVNGRGSIRYSLVLGHVMQRLVGERHVPNLLCSCAPPPSGPLIEAVCRARGGLPPALRDYEPTLIDRFLTNDAATIREEIRVAWRNGVAE
ncbi:MAG TPA: hypothetical protein VLC46_22750 [Thermoanaerobaculia bacterium]|jgi:hypothetical protein|nr:hypothetical protein [Thermoanaerobaculia bacterium]